MDRKNDNVGCLEIEIFPVNNPLDLSCFSLAEEAEISCFTLTEPLQLSCFSLAEEAEISCFTLTEPLQLSCFGICSVNKDSYLRVSTDVVWLTPDMIAEQFEIYSNVVWNIN